MQVVVSSSTHCTLLFCQSFQSKIPTQRKHTFSAPARSNEHLCWRQKSPPDTAAEGKFLTLPPTLQKYVFMVILQYIKTQHDSNRIKCPYSTTTLNYTMSNIISQAYGSRCSAHRRVLLLSRQVASPASASTQRHYTRGPQKTINATDVQIHTNIN